MAQQTKLPKLPRGQGSFFYHRDKIGYRKTFTLPSGRKVKKTVYGENFDECFSKMKLIENNIENEVVISKDTLVEAMTKWLINVKKNRLKPQSLDRYLYVVNHQINDAFIGHLQYQKISAQELQLYINQMNDGTISYSTIQKSYNLIKAFYTYSSIIDRFNNPMATVTLPVKRNVIKKTKKIEWFEQDDINKFITEATRKSPKTKNYVYHNGHAYSANIYLGMRIGELLALQWKDINFEKNYIHVTKTVVQRKNPNYDPTNPNSYKNLIEVQDCTKTENIRYVPINSKAKELLLVHLAIHPYNSLDDYVVCSKTKRLLSRYDVNNTLKIIQRNADTKVQNAASHTLRHTCASLYFRKGIPIEIIAKILGHSVDICRSIYIGLAQEQMQEAASEIVPVIEI